MQSSQRNKKNEVEIDIGELLRGLLRKLPLIILATIAVALVAAFYSLVFVTPKYVASSKMYIMPDQDDNRVTISSQLQAGSMMTSDYIEIIKSTSVADEVISRLHLVNMQGASMKSSSLIAKISVTSNSEARILTITVTDSDPYLAAKISNEVFDVSVKRINEVAGSTTVSVVETAEIPTSRSSPILTKNVMIGAVIGFVVSMIIAVISFVTNDSIKSSDDVEKYLGLSILGVIPKSSSLGESAGRFGKTK